MIIIFQKKVLVTVNVLYYMPDYEHIIQTFFWQTEDIVPDIPRVNRFLDYWDHNIEAKIKRVLVEYD